MRILFSIAFSICMMLGALSEVRADDRTGSEKCLNAYRSITKMNPLSWSKTYYISGDSLVVRSINPNPKDPISEVVTLSFRLGTGWGIKHVYFLFEEDACALEFENPVPLPDLQEPKPEERATTEGLHI